jgi:hypothetical protein
VGSAKNKLRAYHQERLKRITIDKTFLRPPPTIIPPRQIPLKKRLDNITEKRNSGKTLVRFPTRWLKHGNGKTLLPVATCKNQLQVVGFCCHVITPSMVANLRYPVDNPIIHLGKLQYFTNLN